MIQTPTVRLTPGKFPTHTSRNTVHKIVSLDNQLINSGDAAIAAVSEAVFYGKGIFTTVRISNGEPFLWEKHWQRLSDNAGSIGIDLKGHSSNTLFEALREVIKGNAMEQGRARITIFDRSAGSIWTTGDQTDNRTGMLIITGDHGPRGKTFRLTISPYTVNSRSPLAGVKSCNYLEHLFAYERAKSDGYSEAVRANERREITSGCMANLFWIADGRIFTPALETGCLAGTTGEFVLENVQCEQVRADLEVLDKAEAIFLTSAGLGIAPVTELNGRGLAPLPEKIRDLMP